MKRERRKKLTPAELKAAGVSRDFVTRRIPPADRGNRKPPKTMNASIPDARREEA